jgi:hypothetical protein
MFYRSKSIEFARSQPMTECGQCGDRLYLPEWSEYVDKLCVRHLWTCEACDYKFETTVHYSGAPVAV